MNVLYMAHVETQEITEIDDEIQTVFKEHLAKVYRMDISLSVTNHDIYLWWIT